MERLIKEKEADASLCVETGDEVSASLSIVEKYDRFLQGEDFDESNDSDIDYFANDSILKEEYNQIKHDNSEKLQKPKTSRLSTGLPERYNRLETNNDHIEVCDANNGTTDSREDKDEKSGLTKLKKLIEQLHQVRSCGDDGNSIFCDKNELDNIEHNYANIINFLKLRSKSFEKNTEPTSPSGRNNDDITFSDNLASVQSADTTLDRKSFTEHLEAVEKARDRFYVIEQQVRELIEQLELVERYKMESL